MAAMYTAHGDIMIVSHRYSDRLSEKPYIGYIFAYRHWISTMTEKAADIDICI